MSCPSRGVFLVYVSSLLLKDIFSVVFSESSSIRETLTNLLQSFTERRAKTCQDVTAFVEKVGSHKAADERR